MAKRIQLRRDTTANWDRVNPVLAQGEIGVDLTAKNIKVGDGINVWSQLNYVVEPGKLKSLNADTYIEIGEGDESGSIFVVNEGIETVIFSSSQLKVGTNTLLDANTASADPFTGTLVVQGGVGITGDLNVNSDIRANKLTVEDDIEANIIGNVTGNLFGDVLGDVYSSGGVKILESGTNGNNAIFTGFVSGNINSSSGTNVLNTVDINGGTIDNTIIGASQAGPVTGTIVTATNKFVGTLDGNVKGDIYAADGVTKILENGTDGSDAVFYGSVNGTTSGSFVGDIYAQNATSKILENGTDGTNAVFTGSVNGNINSNGLSIFNNIDVNAGFIDNTIIGDTIPARIVGTTIQALERFIGEFEGTITGNTTGDIYAADNGFKVLENGTNGSDAYFVGDIRVKTSPTDTVVILNSGSNGTDAVFTGSVVGDVTGDLTGDVTATNIDSVTLNTTGDTAIGGDLTVAGEATITGNISAQNFNLNNTTLSISANKFTIESASGDTYIDGTLTVNGASTFNGSITANQINATDLTTSGDLDIAGNLSVTGTSSFTGDITAVNIDSSTLDTTGAISIGTDLTVAGISNFTGNMTAGNISAVNIDASGDITIADNLTVTGTSSFTGNMTAGNIDSSTLDTTGNVTVGGTFAVTGTSTFTGDMTAGNIDSSTLDTTGNVGIGGNLSVTGTSSFTGNMTAGNIDSSTLDTTGNVTVGGTFGVTGTSSFTGDMTAGNIDSSTLDTTGNVTVGGTLDVDGATYIDDTLTVTGITSLQRVDTTEINSSGDSFIGGDLTVVGTSSFTGDITAGNIDSSTLDTTGNVGVGGNLSVTGTSTFTGDMTAGNIDSSTLDTTGNVGVGGNLSVTGTSSFTDDITANDVSVVSLDASGNVTITGTLDVTGLVTLANVDINSGTIDNTIIGSSIPAAITATDLNADNITIENEGVLKLKEASANGQNYIGFKAPNEFTTSTTYTLPGTKGLDGYILALNTAGDRLEWVSSDLFGGGQVSVSADYGDDDFDGINKPVKTIKRALQIASGLVYDELGIPNEKRIVISVASGDYVEDNPIIIPDNVSVVGAGLRACNIRPLNANKDMLRVRNGCYFTEITFRDYLDTDKKPYHTFNYAVSFDDPFDSETDRSGYINLPNRKPTITISPYIQNCSIISFLGGSGVLIDGRKVNVPNKPKNAVEAETPFNELPGVPEQGKSMVANAFTMLSFGGTGWRVINDAYAQIVSCFQIFCLNGSYCQSGGYLSITNSATNFGQYALRASGYSPNAFTFDRGIVVETGTSGPQQTITAIGFGNIPVQDYVIRFRNPLFRRGYDLLKANVDELKASTISWINTQIATANADTTPTIWDSFSYDNAKCAEDVGFIIDALIYDLTYGGNLETVVAGKAYYDGNSLGGVDELAPTLAAYEHLKDIVNKIIQNKYVVPSVNNLESQVRSTGASTIVAGLADDLIDDLITYVDPATSDAAVSTPDTSWVDANLVTFSSTMSTQSASIATTITNNITSNYSGLSYDIDKCKRDIGLVIDAVRYDMMFNSQFRSISAARSYYRAQASTVTGSQLIATIDAFTQLKAELLTLVTGNTLAIDRVTDKMDLILGILTSGESSIPNRPYALDIPTSGTNNASDAQVLRARNLIQSNRTFIEAEIIAWINRQVVTKGSLWRSFTYDQVKCARDIGYIVDGIAYDLVSGGNSKSVESGTSYFAANVTNLDRQVEQNIAAFTQLKSEVATLLTDLALNTYTDDLFDDLISCLQDPDTPVDSIDSSGASDITSAFKPVIAGDKVTFNAATSIDLTNNTITVSGQPFNNGNPIVYSSEGQTPIAGLDNEQVYYVDQRNYDPGTDELTFALFTDDSQTAVVDLTALGTGNHAFIKNIREFYIDDIVTSHNEYQVLTLQSGTYNFVPGRLITGVTGTDTNRAYVHSYDPTTRELTVSVELVQVFDDLERNFFDVNSTIDSDHSGTAQTNIVVTAINFRNDLYTSNFRILPTTSGNSLTNLGSLPEVDIWLHRPSIVNSSGHTWEYAGSGVDYNALPQNGGRTRVEYEQWSDLPGRVYSSGTNELGDFKVGDFIKAENKTGNVQFTNTVSIAELDTLKLRIGDIVIQEISADQDLGDNELGGAKNTRLSTQLAVRSFLENRLGYFIDKKVSTNNLPGAVVQLNSTGKINGDLIPPIRNFLIYRSDGYRSRLDLVEDIPAVNILNGDLATETYSTVQLTLDNPVTAQDGDLVVQASTGATGKVIGTTVASTTLIVGSLKATFDVNFNDVNSLTIDSDSTPSTTNTAVTPTLVGSINYDNTANYILSELVRSQFLILDPDGTYDFSTITDIVGALNKSEASVVEAKYGVINVVSNASLDGGSGYTPASGTATYESVSLTNISGTGTGAVADITVTNGIVTSVDIRRGGTGYAENDVVSASSTDLGGTVLDNFEITVSAIQNRLYVINTGLKFEASTTVPEYIEDANAVTKSLTATSTTVKSFGAAAVGGDVDYVNSRITLTAHGLSNGDPVKYSSGVNVIIGGLGNGNVYYVKVVNANTIELYNDYVLATKITFLGSGSGTHSLTISAVEVDTNTFYLSDHGFETGDAIRISGTSLPQGLVDAATTLINNNDIFFIGSVTANSFTIHTQQSTALNSKLGLTVSEFDITTTGSGTISFTEQNVLVIGTVDTASASDQNWSSLSANNVDASNVVTGILNTSRLGTGTANSESFLRGDSTWARAVQNLKITNTSSPLSLVGSFETVSGVNQFYNSVTLDINLVDSGPAYSDPLDPYTNLGVAKFKKSQFDVGTGATSGQVFVKDNVIDAGTVNGNNTNYLVNSSNHTTQPVNKGGTAFTQYTIGDMLYANAETSLAKLPIGTSTYILTSTGSAPQWNTNITVNDLTVLGNISQSGSVSTLTAYDIRMSDNNIEIGSVSAISGRSGIINDVTASSSTVTMSAGNTTDGMIPGMTLTKVFGVGSFGTNAIVTAINSSTQFTFKADTANTIGTINFNVGGASDLTADGGGITVKSSTGNNKTLRWVNGTPAWTASDNFDIPSGKEYKINQTTVLSSTQVLGKGFTSPVGEITTSGSYWTRTFALMGA